MNLLTPEIIRALPPLYSTEKIPLEDKIVICKYYSLDPDAPWAWYVFEGERYTDDKSHPNDLKFFGMIQGFEEEFGFFLLSDLVRSSSVVRDHTVFLQPYHKLMQAYR